MVIGCQRYVIYGPLKGQVSVVAWVQVYRYIELGLGTTPTLSIQYDTNLQ